MLATAPRWGRTYSMNYYHPQNSPHSQLCVFCLMYFHITLDVL